MWPAARHRLRMDRTCFSAAAAREPPRWLVFGAAALFVFLVLAAQYESWNLPLAVVMIVPMCLLRVRDRTVVARHGDRRAWRRSASSCWLD